MNPVADNFINFPPATPWKLCFALFKGDYIPHQLWEGKKFRLKFFLRSFVMPFSTFKILKFITEHPHYEQLILAQPRLPCRLHRPYLSTSLKRHESVDAIIYHYKLIKEFLGNQKFIQHLTEGIHIAEFSGKMNNGYYINFISTHKLDREGESSLILKNQYGDMLCEITFTIYKKSGKRVLMIGGLQGPGGQNAQEIIQHATKDFYGIFPKKLIFEALLILTESLKVESIYAVSNRTHVYHSLRYQNRQRLIHADYSGFWTMLGGALSEDGNYKLNTSTNRKEINSIPSKKRAEYRRRYDLLDSLRNVINSNIELMEKMKIQQKNHLS